MMQNYHFIGIGGIGMSGLANILLQKGIKVSGSDVVSSPMTDHLEKMGAEIFIGHSPCNIKQPTAVIYTTAVKAENPEVEKARMCNVPFMHRSELLQQLMQDYRSLLVTGTHGKTTTSSLLTHVLVDGGLDPAYAIGGMICSLNSNAGFGKGEYFVAEADESDGSFLKYCPFGAIITNIDNDHLDYWKTPGNMMRGFKQFIHLIQSSQHLFWCGDDEILSSINPKGFSYGFDEKNDLNIQNYRQDGWKNIFDISFEGKEYLEIEVPLIGGHNVLNAAAVFGLGIKINIAETAIRKAFCTFRGVNRRAEFKGEKGGISIFDDYGHHPTEIFATLRAIKHAVSPRRVIVAFQPHRYSRTRDCLHEFPPAFAPADQLIVTDIYPAGEAPILDISNEMLLKTLKGNLNLDVRHIGRSKLSEFLAQELQPEDVLVTMGAGDITKVGPEIIGLLK